MTQFKLNIGMASKRGPRERNEDAAAVSPSHDFFAVADGIGGAPLGDIASTLCCNAATIAYQETEDLDFAFDRANEELLHLKDLLRTHDPAISNLSPLSSQPSSQFSKVTSARAPHVVLNPSSPTFGTGCTLLLANLKDDRFNVAWAGDTVALRLRAGLLESVAWPDNVNETNELASAVGYTQGMTPLRNSCSVRAGDRFLLCSDGVWAELSDEHLSSLLASSDNAPWLAELVTREAIEQGHDNATAIVIVVCDDEHEGEAEVDEPAEHVLPGAMDTRQTPFYPTISYA